MILGLVLGCGQLALAACSSDEAPANTANDGDAASSPTADGVPTNTSGDGGLPGDPGNPPPDSGTDAPTTQGTGFAALGADDGITAIVDGTVRIFTTQALHIPQGNDSLLIGAKSSDYTQTWTIRMKATLGTQSCTGDVDTDDVSMSYAKVPDYENGGTTVSPGTCTINLTSLTPKVEGTFVASLKSGNNTRVVTDGAFRITN